ncbi:hypothetical protein ACAW74_16475 [Fibrella sp. WM1]|uniref:hypothetical protein n=1 Tax=Fibrella musci TaxID=3242485 RepID=UPI00351FDD16
MFFSLLRKTGYALGLLGLALACKPGPDPIAPPQPPKPGVPTAVGKPIGAVISKTIGPAGGTLSSADGTMTLRFPAGALTKETLITAQPVENTAFGGAGVGYEFGPHGTQFAKPVTLSWTYKDSDLHGSSPEALGIAVQDDNHIWRGHTSLFVEADQRRVVAPIYHFSRYSFYENFWMEPMQQTLAPNETVTLKVFYQENHGLYESKGSEVVQEPTPCKPTSETEVTQCLGADLLTPLTSPVELLKADQVKNWRVNGQDVTGTIESPIGFLSYHQGQSVIYKAPVRAPEANPVAVSVEIITPGKGKLMLVSNLTIESPNELYINGAKQPNAYANANVAELGAFIFVGPEPYKNGNQKQTGVAISFSGIGGTGTFTLSKEIEGRFSMTAIGPDGLNYSGSYAPRPNGGIVYGPGSVTITEFNSAKELIAGSFTATLHYQDLENKRYKSMQVKGRFRTGG